MIGSCSEGAVHISPEVLEGLSGQSEDEIHRNCFKWDFCQSAPQRIRIHHLSSQYILVLFPERLYPYADLGDSGILQLSEGLRLYVIGMKLYADAFRDIEVFFKRLYDLSDPVRSERRGASSEVEAGHLFPAVILAADHADLLKKKIYVASALFFPVYDLAVRAEAANASAERYMHIESKVLKI